VENHEKHFLSKEIAIGHLQEKEMSYCRTKNKKNHKWQTEEQGDRKSSNMRCTMSTNKFFPNRKFPFKKCAAEKAHGSFRRHRCRSAALLADCVSVM
jgi:hypothetical protein